MAPRPSRSRGFWPITLATLSLCAFASAEDLTPVGSALADRGAEWSAEADPTAVPQPFKLAMEPADQSVYALPAPPGPNEGVNGGGINLDVKVTYFTDYIYRGVDRTAFISDVTRERSHDRANFQFEGKLAFNLGKLPHPFIGVFTNVLDSDPVSNFQEVRPSFGFDWAIRPLVISAGNNTYIFPNRSPLGTGEGWGKIMLDDSVLFRTDRPVFSPYIYGAYDYDIYKGWYFEAGVSHEFVIEGTGMTLTVQADVAYVVGQDSFAGPTGKDTGFQHYEVGAVGRYSLNTLLNIPQRFGQWSLNGYLFYTDGLDKDLRGDTQLYGGAGLELQY
jgi:hypothetical protein